MSAIKTLQQIDPKNALLYLNLRTQYLNGVSAANMFADGNMEAVGAAAWYVGNGATLSKQSAAPTAGQCLRVAYNAINNPFAYQLAYSNPTITYTITGYARSDGTVLPVVINNSGIAIWTGTNSTSWQQFSAQFTNPGQIVGLQAATSSAGYVEFDNVVLTPNVLQVFDNLGRYPGAPATVKSGDGATTSMLATQLVGRRGCSFNGSSQYIDTGIVDFFERTDKFSLFCCFSCTNNSATKSLVSCSDDAQSGKGINAYAYLGNAYYSLANTGTTNECSVVSYGPTNATLAPITTVCFTYNGSSNVSGITTYVLGASRANNTGFNTLSATIKSGKPIIIGARHNGAAKAGYFQGNIYHISIWPFVELTPQQVLYLDRTVMRSIMLP